MDTFIFKSNGIYLGFIREDNYFFSRDGVYLGWIENGFAWDTNGQFRGKLMGINQHNYILKNMYAVPPIPKNPKTVQPLSPSISTPQSNIPPIDLPFGLTDGF